MFCYGEQWCSLLQRVDFQRFFNSDVAKPIRLQYLHSMAVPKVLDPFFCEELHTYQGRLMDDSTKEYTLAMLALAAYRWLIIA
jgi:hypothetical protein